MSLLFHSIFISQTLHYRSQQQKQQLKQYIMQYIEQLTSSIEQQKKLINPNALNSAANKQIQGMIQKVQILERRLSLIDKCQEFSLHRLNHLEEVFKYYCTHIFKIGKHMTFDRLEYEKEHLNTERFFLFLKDFGLTVTQIEGKIKQIVSKQAIMTIFKRISSTSRDLTFQQFVKCLEKIGILYYDQKSNYWRKIQEQKLERIRRKKQIEKRKIKRMRINGQKIDQNLEKSVEMLEQQQKELNIGNNKQNQNNQEKQQGYQQKEDEQNQIKPQIQQSPINNLQASNQNDDLIQELMGNKDLEDPNQQINQIAKQKKFESLQLQKKKKNQKNHQTKLLSLTNNEKIQFFYQLIGVDSVKDYKNKLTILNMIEFKGKKGGVNGEPHTSRQHKTISMEDSVNNPMEKSKSAEDQQRLHKLKEKMNQKKEKRKNQPIPKPKEVQQSQTAKQRRLMKQERQFRMAQKIKQKQMQNDALKQKVKDEKKVVPKGPNKNQQNSNPTGGRVNFNEKQVNWQMLQKMSFDQLKLRQFNPTKLYHQQDDDYIFMQQYGNFRAPNRASRMQARQRQSLSIVENVRKRADEVEKSQRKQETKFNNKVQKGSFKGKF